MVRTLQIKFVKTAMTAITVLLLVVICAISGIYSFNLYSQSKSTAEMLANNGGIPDFEKMKQYKKEGTGATEDWASEGWVEGEMPPQGQGQEGFEPGPPEQEREDISGQPQQGENGGTAGNMFFMGKMSPDDVMSVRYFIVNFDSEGGVESVDTGSIYSVSDEEAEEYGAEVIAKGNRSGITGNFSISAAITLSAARTPSMATRKAGLFLRIRFTPEKIVSLKMERMNYNRIPPRRQREKGEKNTAETAQFRTAPPPRLVRRKSAICRLLPEALSRGRGLQLITETVNGGDRFRAQFLAEALHMNVHRSGLARRDVPPGGPQKLVPGNGFAGVLRQLAEQAVFLFGQREAFSVHVDGAVGFIQIKLRVVALRGFEGKQIAHVVSPHSLI